MLCTALTDYIGLRAAANLAKEAYGGAIDDPGVALEHDVLPAVAARQDPRRDAR